MCGCHLRSLTPCWEKARSAETRTQIRKRKETNGQRNFTESHHHRGRHRAIHTPTMSPHLPITPRELIDDIMSVYEAGGAVAHLHVRDPETGQPKADQTMFREVATEVKRRCDIVICATTGGSLGDTVENRAKVVSSLKPELASLNAGSMNFALFHVVPKYAGQWKYDWEETVPVGHR